MTTPPDTNRVYTLDDLRRWESIRPGLPVSFAVIGHPIAHSRSPLMHNAALARLAATNARLAGWAYFKFDIAPERLAEALPLFHDKGFRGLNLTIPHKVDAVALVSEISPQGRAAGAVNTLVRRSSGGWLGHNTDGEGFRLAAQSRLKNATGGAFDIRGGHVVVLGAGGAARAVVSSCLEAGYGDAASVTIAARDFAKADALAKFFPDARVKSAELSGLSRADLPKGALIVNCTPLGLKLGESSPVASDILHPDLFVYDTTYSDTPSRLMVDALNSGVPERAVASGLSMLCAQGAEALRCWLDDSWTGRGKPTSSWVEGDMWRALGQTTPFILP